MNIVILLLSMIFFHIIDDYYLQGILASMKQKSWRNKNTSNPSYKNDYLMALFEHAFSWTFMIHVPIVIYLLIFGLTFNLYIFLVIFVINWTVHIITDNAKANKLKINLIQDQLIHISQIVLTWIIYSFIV